MAASLPLPIEAGHGTLEQIFSNLLQKIPRGNLKALTALLSSACVCIGTGCSGLETPWFATRALEAAFAANGMSVLPFKHIFAAEIHAEKARFIRDVCGGNVIFKDICDLGNARAVTWFSGMAAVVTAHVFIAGFSCRNMSRLNKKRKHSDNYLRDFMGTSGVTFRGVTQYLRAHMPRVAILENVKGIQGQPLQDAMDCLRELGYMVVVQKLNSLDFCLPQSRPRVWLFCLRRSLAERHPSGLEGVERSFTRWCDLLRSNNGRVPLESLLLSETDPEIVHSQVAVHKPHRSVRGRQRWIMQHALADRQWFDSPVFGEFSDLRETFPGLNALSLRQADLLQKKIAAGLRIGGQPARVLDLNFSLKYSGDSAVESTTEVLHSPCVLPRGKLFHSGRGRLLRGLEALRLQGIWLERRWLREFPNDLMSLGCASCLLKVFTCVLLDLAECVHPTKSSGNHLVVALVSHED